MSATRTLLRKNPFNKVGPRARKKGVTEPRGTPSRRTTRALRLTGADWKAHARYSMYGKSVIPLRFIRGLQDAVLYDISYHYTKGFRVARAT